MSEVPLYTTWSVLNMFGRDLAIPDWPAFLRSKRCVRGSDLSSLERKRAHSYQIIIPNRLRPTKTPTRTLRGFEFADFVERLR